MRILPARTDHVSGRTAGENAEANRSADRRGHDGEPVPVRYVRKDTTRHLPRCGTRSIAMTITRRKFVKSGAVAGTGLLIGVRFSGNLVHAQESEKAKHKKVPNPFDAYIHVTPEGKISLIVGKWERGKEIKPGRERTREKKAEVNLNPASVL